MRYDPIREVYRDCRWCRGRGCIYCKSEADKAYRAEFPNGPQPIATFKLSSPEDIEVARAAIGADAIAKAFGVGGGGMQEIMQNIAKVKGGAA